MKNKWFKISISVLICLFFTIGTSQPSGYLAQKLMLENNLRERISSALSKVIDESQYVVDVSVELKLSDAVEEQVTYFTGKKQQESPFIKPDRPIHLQPSANDAVPRADSKSMVGLPIPGFEFEVEQQPSENIRLEVQPTLADEIIQAEQKDDSPNILSKTSSFKRPSTAQIIKQEISIILQEGSSPELIENIRQLVMMASRYNRARGDVLSIMTASFKERRDVRSAEQVMLRALVEKIESLEVERSKPAEKTNGYGQKDVEDYKEKMREFVAFVDSVKKEEKERLYQQEIEKAVAPHLEKIEQLQDDLMGLQASDKFSLGGEKADSVVEQKEKQLKKAETHLDEIFVLLERAKEDFEKSEKGGISNTFLLVSLIGGFLLIVLLAVFFSLQGKSRHQYPPPPWMYPPRRPKKKTKKNVEATQQESGTIQREVFPSKQEIKALDIEDDASVVRSEINDMKKAVVSMSVGQPAAAAKIVKEWMEDDIPPSEPVPTPVSTQEEEPNKKSKKKKKK